MYWDRNRIPREREREEYLTEADAEAEAEAETEIPHGRAPTTPAAPQWFAEALSGLELPAEPEGDPETDNAPKDNEKGWSLTRLAALAAAAGGLYWAFTYDPISRFPKEQFAHPRLFGELDQAIGYGHQHAGRIVAATPYGVVMHGAKVPVSGGFAAPSGYSRGYSGAGRGHGFAGLDDLDDLGGDGGDLIGDDFGGDGDDL